mgnify:CR=1 FL=1
MGHMTLIAEEIIKLFEHYPKEIGRASCRERVS